MHAETPVSRRAARAQRLATGEQPVVSVPAPRDAADAGPAPEPAGVEDFELIEPAPTAAPAVDQFEAAARLFSFTGETPIQSAGSDPAEHKEPPKDIPAATAHIAPRRGRAAFKRAAATTFSIGVVGVVGLLTLGMTMPAEALAAVNGRSADVANSLASDIVAPGGESIAIAPDEIQAYVAPAELQTAGLGRTETYATASLADLAAELGIRHPSDFYVNDPNAAIQWPFAVGVGISWGFVWRDGRQHEGADFTPGEGAHVQAIADGTVRIATENGGGFGVTVLIDHIIDGQLISSRYAHMLVGSLQVKAGDQVKVGQYLGRTGNTGHSFGAHTHVEILANGTTPIDPIAWLRANAGRDSLG